MKYLIIAINPYKLMIDFFIALSLRPMNLEVLLKEYTNDPRFQIADRVIFVPAPTNSSFPTTGSAAQFIIATALTTLQQASLTT